MPPNRLDAHLAAIGAFPSRARAQGAVKAGLVRVNGTTVDKPSQTVHATDKIDVDGDVHDYVSRGALKLVAALDAFDIAPKDKVCLDLGASTGGFTEVLLRRDARKIYAVDVGTSQLARKIADDARVENLQKTHAKELSVELVPEQIDLIVCDVSFISLKKALPPALALAGRNAKLAALVKPQFEVGRSEIGKGGLVKPGEGNSIGVIEDISTWLEKMNWQVDGWVESPILGGDGNREFLIAAGKSQEDEK